MRQKKPRLSWVSSCRNLVTLVVTTLVASCALAFKVGAVSVILSIVHELGRIAHDSESAGVAALVVIVLASIALAVLFSVSHVLKLVRR